MPWIWQNHDWIDALRWDAARVLPLLAATRRAQGHLFGRAERLGFELGIELHADTVVLDAMKTSAVEGELLDPVGVRSSVARQLGIPSAGRAETARATRAVEGLVQILLDATSRASEPLTMARLHGWHAALFPTGHSGIRPITVAGWRDGSEPMQVVSGRPGKMVVHYEAPPAARLPAEMRAFLDWFSSSAEPEDGVLRAALAHLRFVTLHPYDDGNGRIGRAITDLALARDDETDVRLYSMSAQIEADRAGYYEQLKRAQGGDGDITEWMTWFIATLGSAIASAEVRIDAVLARVQFWERHGGVALSERQSKVVRRMLKAGPGGFEGGMTTRKYASLVRVSRATAQRELADLLEKQVLVLREGRGRSTAYDLAW